MKALILNSGVGSRLKDITSKQPKCCIPLYNKETILDRQIRILSSLGIKDYIITTGPYENLIVDIISKYPNLNFILVPNKNYLNTNYIVSIYNTKKYIDDDILLLHGDLVFNKNIISKILNNPYHSISIYNEVKELPKKDFKARYKNNILKEVSINIFDNCITHAPIYKLDKNTMHIWLKKIEEYINNGEVKVYAENALNEITNIIKIHGISYKDDYCEEIDDLDDYIRVNEEIKYIDNNIKEKPYIYKKVKYEELLR